MEIKILKELKENFTRDGFFNQPLGYIEATANHPDDPFDEAITIQKISELEDTYNNGNPFPRALKELLYLAGDYCIVLDYSPKDSAGDLQEDVREELERCGYSISRPFFCFDSLSAYTNNEFAFVYTDVTVDDPLIYIANMKKKIIKDESGGTLSQFINSRLEDVKKGFNPF